MTDLLQLALVLVAGFAAGAVNALAGGGTLLVYPALLAAGLPPVGANVTSLLGLIPGYVGAGYAYRGEIAQERRRLPALGIASVIGAVVGAVVLLTTPGKVFQSVVPYLVLLSCALLLAQPWLKKLLAPSDVEREGSSAAANVSAFVSAAYGAYFSAGVGVLLLALLGATLHSSLQRINGLKNFLSLLIVLVGGAIYAFSGHADWLDVLILLPSSAIGGIVGGALARKLNGSVLRYAVCALGVALAIVLFLE